MKNNIIKYLFAIITVCMAFSCETFDYNDEHIGGFDPNPPIVDVQALALTLIEGDYKLIAENKTNQEIALAAGVVDELAALGKQFHFSDKITADVYIPALLKANYDSYLNNGSTIEVTYDKAVDVAPEIGALAISETYELTPANYQVAWGEESTTAYFTPNMSASTYLSRILKTSIESPKDGEYVVASYEYSSSEPSTGGGDLPGETINKISDVIAGSEFTVQGKVSALYERGYILADETGNILVFDYETPSFSLGDVVKVKAMASVYGNGMQFNFSKGNDDAVVTFIGKTSSYAYPTPEVMSGADLSAYEAAAVAEIKYVSYTGVISLGQYINVKVAGKTGNDASISVPHSALIDPALDGKTVVVHGYLFQGGSRCTTMATSVVEVGQTAKFTPIGIVASQPEAGTYKVKGAVVANNTTSILVSDYTGYVLVYNPDIVAASPVGSLVTIDGDISFYAGLVQYGNTATVVTLPGDPIEVENPIAMPVNGTYMDAAIDIAAENMASVKYVSYTGVLTASGGYYNVAIADAFTLKSASIANPQDGLIAAELMTAAETDTGVAVIVTGYALGITGGGDSKYFNTMAISVKAATPAAMAAMSRAANTENRLAVYQYNGGSWSTQSNTTVVEPADYKAMGISDDFFSSSNEPATYLVNFLKTKFPYALAEDAVFVAYTYEFKKDDIDIEERRASQYEFDGSEWKLNDNITSEVGPYKKIDGKWLFNPSQTISLIGGRGIEISEKYYTAAVKYVADNKNPLYFRDGNLASNSELFSGCSYGFNNLNWKKSTTLEYYWGPNAVDLDISAYVYPTDVAGMTAAEIVAAKIKCDKAFYDQCALNFGETMSVVLAELHSEATLIAGVDIIYTVQVKLYTDYIFNTETAPLTHTSEFKLVGNGEFEYVVDSFKALLPKFDLVNAANYE